MRVEIALATVEPDDLVAVHVYDGFTIELRTPPTGAPTVVQGGRRFLEAWQTVGRFAAVASPSDTVELLQRRADGEKIRHPHGWAFTKPSFEAPMHYFRDTRSLCGAVIGYGGLCYPVFDPHYFPEEVTLCDHCLAAGGEVMDQ